MIRLSLRPSLVFSTYIEFADYLFVFRTFVFIWSVNIFEDVLGDASIFEYVFELKIKGFTKSQVYLLLWSWSTRPNILCRAVYMGKSKALECNSKRFRFQTNNLNSRNES